MEAFKNGPPVATSSIVFDKKEVASPGMSKQRHKTTQSLGTKVNFIADVLNNHKSNEEEERAQKAKSNLEQYIARKRQAEEEERNRATKIEAERLQY